MIASAAALLLGLLAAACNGEVVGGGQRPARVVVVSGDLQRDTVGKELKQPLVVRVVDDQDRPVKNQLVNFVVTAGGGSVFAGSALTNAQGEARERWTLGTVAGDTQRVEARAVDPATGEAIVFETFRAIGVPDVLAGLVAVGPVTRAGTAEEPLADSLAVRGVDKHGNAIAGVQVQWAAVEGGGTLSPATSKTDAAGTARSSWTLGPVVGSQVAQASSAAGAPVRFTATAGALPAVRIVLTPEALSFSSLGDVAPLAVTAYDRKGAAIPGLAVMIISENAAVVQVNPGPAAVAKGNGTTRLIAALGDLRDTIPAVVFQVPASLHALPTNTRYGGAGAPVTEPPVVRAVDGRGSPVAGATVKWAVVAGGGSVSAETTQTDASGVASVQWTQGAQGAQTLEARSGTAVPATFTGTILPASVYFHEGPSTLAPGSSAEFVFSVRYGSYPLPGVPVEWSLLSPGGATLTPHSAHAGPDGMVRATLTVTSLQADHIIRVRPVTVTDITQVTGIKTVSVTGPITMTNVSGSGARGIAPATGYAQARISSTAGAITRARATLAGREAELSYDASTQLWKGSIDMAGVPGGMYTGTVIATDAAGNSRAAPFEAHHDPNPVVVIVEPSTESATGQGSIRVRATCSWQTSRPADDCTDLYSAVYTESALILPYAQGRSGIDVNVPLPAGPATVRITVQWNDSKAVYYVGKDTVEVTVSP
jgi:hypothetical protein